MRILIDMDGVVVNLIGPWLEAYNRKFGDHVTREDITSWGIADHVNCSPKAMFNIIKRRGFFDHLPAHDGAINAVTRLKKEGHDIRFATTPTGSDSALGKIDWITREFRHLDFDHSHVILMHDKDWLAPGVDVLIDDRPKTIETWGTGKHDARIIGISHPYNQEAKQYADFWAESHRDMEAAWNSILEYLL